MITRLSSCRHLLFAFALVVAPISLEAQRATEWQLHAMANVGGDTFLGGGIGFALRTNGRMRVGVTASAGDLEGAAAIRPELLGSFHLNPFKRQGVSPYASAGVAAVFSDEYSRWYIVALVGIESRPGTAFGWFVEAGLGGGARLAAGVQYRKRRTRAR